MLSNLPESLDVYRAAWLILTKRETSIEEIDAQETGLGLIEHGNGDLTRLLETLFEWSRTFRLHALYHDVFGRIYICIFKGSPLFGHLTGLLSFILLGKNIGRMTVNKI